MKKEKFVTKDGNEGFNYKPEAGDEYICLFDSVGTRQNAAVVKGKDKPVIINNNYLGVKFVGTGEEVTLTLTNGQTKKLNAEGDLKGKTIVFEDYQHKDWGTLLGVNVKK